MHETFWALLQSSGHWEFEIFLMLIFDGVIVGLCWPFLRKHWQHHVDRDKQDTPWTPGAPFPEGTLCRTVQDWSLSHPDHVSTTYGSPSEGWPDESFCPRCGLNTRYAETPRKPLKKS